VKSDPIPVWSKVIVYCVFQFQVMDEGALMLKLTEFVVPDAGTLPVPVQPVQMYRVVPTVTTESTEAVIDDPESNQPPLGVGVPCAEFTVK